MHHYAGFLQISSLNYDIMDNAIYSNLIYSQVYDVLTSKTWALPKLTLLPSF